MFAKYTTDRLIYLVEKYDRLERNNPDGATYSVGDCGHAHRGYYTFPACRECMKKEIERREDGLGN